jgi:hypothetical protein
MDAREKCLRAASAAWFVLLIVTLWAGLAPAIRAQNTGDPKPASVTVPAKCPHCQSALTSTGWCDKCGVGQAKGVETKCKSCLAAIQTDGWCKDCNVGYVAGSKVECKGCYTAMTAPKGGWCDDCKMGYAKGLKTECKSCLAAIQTDGWCDDCKMGYVAGKSTTCKNCYALMSKPDGGWCKDCNVGYAKGLKTSCKSCLAAIVSNGTCKDCGIRFENGHSFQQVAMTVDGLTAKATAQKVREVLGAQPGVSKLQVDPDKGAVSCELETTKGDSVATVVQALTKAGIKAQAGK